MEAEAGGGAEEDDEEEEEESMRSMIGAKVSCPMRGSRHAPPWMYLFWRSVGWLSLACQPNGFIPIPFRPSPPAACSLDAGT